MIIIYYNVGLLLFIGIYLVKNVFEWLSEVEFFMDVII